MMSNGRKALIDTITAPRKQLSLYFLSLLRSWATPFSCIAVEMSRAVLVSTAVALACILGYERTHGVSMVHTSQSHLITTPFCILGRQIINISIMIHVDITSTDIYLHTLGV
jgi:hypothetical protein